MSAVPRIALFDAKGAPGLFLAVGRFVAVFSTFDAKLGSVNLALAFACEMSIVPVPETLDGPLNSFYVAINPAYLDSAFLSDYFLGRCYPNRVRDLKRETRFLGSPCDWCT